MKIGFLIFLCITSTASIVSAQNSSSQEIPVKEAFSVDIVNPPTMQKGDANYLLSLSGQDLKNGNYVFYTDSNATVAHIRINGNDIRLTGGANAEHIMAYVCKGYTVTLSINKIAGDTIIPGGGNIEGTLAIYNSMGQVVGKKVRGVQVKRAGN